MTYRVVVTGLGAISPFGKGVHRLWCGLVENRTAIKRLNGSEWKDLPCCIGGVLSQGHSDGGLNIEKDFNSTERKSMSQATLYGVLASDEAIKDSGCLASVNSDLLTIGVCIGTGMSVFTDITEAAETLKRGYRYLSPYFIPKILPNMTAGQVAIRHGLKGPCISPSTACTTGLHAVGDAFRLVQQGHANAMLAGGTEAPLNPLSVAGFCRARALTTRYNDRPEVASRPFDKARSGFVMSEGAAVVVLEQLQHARQRNAQIYAEILGYGLSGDGHHMTAPPEDGCGAYRAMVAALRDAGVEKNKVGYINAHATSTPLGDAAEAAAVARLFGEQRSDLHVSSIKGAVGHLLGAAGSIEMLSTCLSCKSSLIPPTRNLDEVSHELPKLSFVSREPQDWSLSRRRIALTNSFGFGGANASLCLSNYVEDDELPLKAE